MAFKIHTLHESASVKAYLSAVALVDHYKNNPEELENLFRVTGCECPRPKADCSSSWIFKVRGYGENGTSETFLYTETVTVGKPATTTTTTEIDYQGLVNELIAQGVVSQEMVQRYTVTKTKTTKATTTTTAHKIEKLADNKTMFNHIAKLLVSK
jgi:hypothetical protein